MSDSPYDLAQFVGRFHPLLVHLPIGFLAVVGLLEVAALRPAWRHLAAANRAILLLAIPASATAAFCGWLLAGDGGYDAELLRWHRWTGIALTLLVPFLAVLHFRGWTRAYRAGLAACLGLLGFVGHLGGSLTHGSNFMTEHAPPILRRLLGDDAPPTPRPRPADPLTAPLYTTAIQPIFETYCTSCHGAEKSKGGLRLHTTEGLTQGGDNGPVLVAGQPRESLLVKAVELPEEHDDHMPPTGKRQPSPDEIALLAWWIESGASLDRGSRELGLPARFHPLLDSPSGSPPARGTR